MKEEQTYFKILCIVKNGHPQAWTLAYTIKDWFDGLHGSVIIEIISAQNEEDALLFHAKTSHAVLVIGGDGTMLSAARRLFHFNIPFLGINFGKVGFLMSCEPIYWQEWVIRLLVTLASFYNYPLEQVLNTQQLNKDYANKSLKKLIIEEHFILDCELIRDGKVLQKLYAINDAVIARESIARTISLSISIDKNKLSELRCDGFIISTPLGATAYAFSAHGPLALPGLNAQILTPICPFANSFPPCVVSGSSIVNIEVIDDSTPVVLTMDGQEVVSLLAKDVIQISSNTSKITLLVDNKAWYSKRLVETGFIRDGIGMKKNLS